MLTYRVDVVSLTFEKLEYDKRTQTEIWIGGKRRDLVTKRYRFIDNLLDVQAAIEDAIIDLEAKEQVELNKKYKLIRDELQSRIDKASTSFGRL